MHQPWPFKRRFQECLGSELKKPSGCWLWNKNRKEENRGEKLEKYGSTIGAQMTALELRLLPMAMGGGDIVHTKSP